VTFYGVRGSTPTACERTRRYGGNTACVALQVADEPPLLLDLGTGLRFFGETQPDDGSFRGSALVSHLHWDHVQGLPFFVPILRPGASFDVYAPSQEDGRSVAEAFQGMYVLDAACRIQLLAQAGGALLEVPQAVVDGMPQQSREVTHGQGASLLWPALLRRLDRRLPGYDA